MIDFENPDSAAIKALLEHIEVIAVVGASPNPARPSHRVAAALQGWGYRIVPVRPGVERVLGERAYPDLAQVPGRIDLVDVFRAPDQVDPIVDVCIARGVPALWLQDGVINAAAASRARDAGILVVMNRCIYRDYRAFFGDSPRATR